MTQTTTAVGRAQLPHPDLGFDTDDGGIALHNALESIWTSVSNHLSARWTGSIVLGNTASTTVTHNFNLAIAKLKVVIFEAGVQRTAAQVAADYSITQTSVNAIAIQNVSGGSKTFNAIVIPFRFGIVDADVDPATSFVWDVTNGAAPTYKNLYVNGAFSHSGSTEYFDVVILGNLTLLADMQVNGNLYVTGQVISSGFKVNVNGDMTCIGGAAMNASAKTMIVRGNLYSGAAFTFENTHASDSHGALQVGGSFRCVSLTNVAKNIDMSGKAATGQCAGNNLQVGGDLVCEDLDLRAIASASAGASGGTVTCQGDITCAVVTLSGSTALISGDGQQGGSFTCFGNAAVRGALTSVGGAGLTNGFGAPGGNISCQGSMTVGGSINLVGGAGAGATGEGGWGGQIYVYGNLKCDGTVISLASGAQTASSGGWAQPVGGLNVSGDLIAPSADITTAGTSSASASGVTQGANVTIGGDCSCKSLTVDGGATSLFTSGGASGTVTIDGSLMQGVAGVTSFSSQGGNNTNTAVSKAGGDVGPVTIGGDWICKGTVTIKGGASSSTPTGAKGGSGRAVGAGPIIIVHGDVRWVADAGTIPNHSIIGGAVTISTGNDSTSWPGNSPGLAVYGHCTINGVLNVASGLNLGTSRTGEAFFGPCWFFGGCSIRKLWGDYAGWVNGQGFSTARGVDLPWIFNGFISMGSFDIAAMTGQTMAGSNFGGIRISSISGSSPIQTVVSIADGGDNNSYIYSNSSTPTDNTLPQGVDVLGSQCVGTANGANTEWRMTSFKEEILSTTFTFNGSGGTTGSASIKAIKVGNMIFIALPTAITGTTGTASTTLTSNTALSTKMRPRQNSHAMCFMRENGADVNTIGRVALGTNGIFTITRDIIGTAWANAQANSGTANLRQTLCFSAH